jgi:hypothetical protein
MKTRTAKTNNHPARFFCENPVTHKFDEIFPESEIGENELVIPMFWGCGKYVTIPGTEFYGSPYAS